jgi:hypothetical protein
LRNTIEKRASKRSTAGEIRPGSPNFPLHGKGYVRGLAAQEKIDKTFDAADAPGLLNRISDGMFGAVPF